MGFSDYSDTPAPPLHDNLTDINIQITPCSRMRCGFGTVCQELTVNCLVAPCEKQAHCVNATDDATAIIDPRNSTQSFNPCMAARCTAGTECHVMERNCSAPPCEKYAQCMNITDDATIGGCAAMTCGPGHICEEALVKCAKAPCPRHAMCIPDTTQNGTTSSCASVSCPVGENCEETEVQCFVAPCAPRMICDVHYRTVDVGCDDVKCKSGYGCKYDVSERDGNYIKLYCAPIEGPTVPAGCAMITCPVGETCEEVTKECFAKPCPTRISCVSHPLLQPTLPPVHLISTIGCDLVRCPKGRKCQETAMNSPNITSVPDPTYDVPFVRCDSIECPDGSTCKEYQVNCTYPPCAPRMLCGNPTYDIEISCDNVKCPVGHVCGVGIFSCDIYLGLCVDFKCYPGTMFETVPVEGCDMVNCPVGEICEEVTTVKCSKEPCPKLATCVPYPQPPPVHTTNRTIVGCDLVRCPEGKMCRESCDHPPCSSSSTCVPSPFAPQPDYGFVGCEDIECPNGGICRAYPQNCSYPPCAPRMICDVKSRIMDISCEYVKCKSGYGCGSVFTIQDGHNYTKYTCRPNDDYLGLTPIVCDWVTCPVGETCEEEETNECSWKPCPKLTSCVPAPQPQPPVAPHQPVNTTYKGCNIVKCPDGEICEESMVDCVMPPCLPYISCVPDPSHRPPVVGCSDVKCPSGESCVETPVDCVKAPCGPLISCVPNSGGCASATCPVGEICQEMTVECFAKPCPKAVSCVPMNANQNSTARQGCDVVRCRANEVCEEQTVQCLKAPCPIQVACVSIVHTNGTAPTTNSSAPATGAPPGNVCPKNQTMSNCLNTCSENKCPGGETNMMCTKHCGQGCACAAGFVRSSDGECYKSKDCPPEQMCGLNEEYRCEKCAGTCKDPEPNCPGPKNKNCNKKCICAAGFVKKNGKCVTLASCPDHDHTNITCLGTQDFTDCLPKCRQLCSGQTECDTNMHTEMCTPGCVCRQNYKLDSNGECVHNRHCFKTTDCPDNEEWSKCVSDDNICNMATIQKVPLRDRCFSGCICTAGFARNSNGTCVEESKC